MIINYLFFLFLQLLVSAKLYQFVVLYVLFDHEKRIEKEILFNKILFLISFEEKRWMGNNFNLFVVVYEQSNDRITHAKLSFS